MTEIFKIMSSELKYPFLLDEENFKRLLKETVFEAIQESGIAISQPQYLPKDIGDILFAMEITGLSKSTIYNKVNLKEIPHYKQGRLYFSRNELLEWMKTNKSDDKHQKNTDITKYMK